MENMGLRWITKGVKLIKKKIKWLLHKFFIKIKELNENENI